MSKDFDKEANTTREENSGDQNYAFKNVLKKNPNKRTWSVVSIVLAGLSILLLPIPILPVASIVLALLAIGAAVLSRVNLGYFDKLSLAGLIISIFGSVFSLAGIIFFDMIINLILGL